VAVRDSIVRDSVTAGVMVAGAEASIENTLIVGITPTPRDDAFGDGVVALGLLAQPTVVVRDSALVDLARAGAASFGGLVDLERVAVECAAFDLAIEDYNAFAPSIRDLGGNRCGCGSISKACKALSASLVPPEPPPAL
jgi:hypothetical protein